ncbi:uncharacterized protein LOC112561700 [Pomacea canaliculata]|uniref:uncharacterized protein LOC112561700 n=1 Tax=Pomacea canaliculata TaxID=400727 RepID=UPI000D72E079|nr:uncharacterized protein LOC112561700 [Pomacea canaliculata]
MGHFTSSSFCFVLLVSLAAVMSVIIGNADAATTALGVQCTAGSQCDRRSHCVKRSPSDDHGYCERFLRSGEVCSQLYYTMTKPEGMVNYRLCGPGLMCQIMHHRDNPDLMECTSVTR